jgi:hypothetical protein
MADLAAMGPDYCWMTPEIGKGEGVDGRPAPAMTKGLGITEGPDAPSEMTEPMADLAAMGPD